jgi:hypothetical protein
MIEISGPDSLYRVVYVSRATQDMEMSQAECVAHILTKARAFNGPLQVTGALLACDDWFLQVLEGRRLNVDKVLRRIYADRSHTDIRRLYSGPIQSRQFAKWAMCANTVSPLDAEIVEVLRTRGGFDGTRIGLNSAIKLLLVVCQLQEAHANAPQL